MANTRNNLILQGFGGPKLVTQGFGPDLAYRTAFYYDRKGNVTCVLDPDNGQTYYTYDKMSRMTSVLNPWGETAYYEYSPGGKLLARTLGNGCVTYYEYDRRGLTKVENLTSDLSVISTFEYQRDRTGNPLSILREDGSCVYYEYDLNQQLTAETQTDDTGAVVYAWEWDYDRAGNRLWQTFNGEATYYAYNAGNELVTETTAGATTYYDYDRNGNQTAKQAVDGTTYFHYDFENLLRQIDLPDGAHNYFTYDADGKRVSAQDSTGYTQFIYQGPDMLKLMQEKDAAGNTQAQYTMGQGLESMRRGEDSSFYHYDALGSTQELTDATEAVTDTYRYNAWGIIVKRTGGTVNPHSYVGRERYYAASSPGLYQLGFRYYSASSGGFVTIDPQWLTSVLLMEDKGRAMPELTAPQIRWDASSGPQFPLTQYPQAGTGRILTTNAVRNIGRYLEPLQRYAYVRNEPVGMTDPIGLGSSEDFLKCCLAGAQRKKDRCDKGAEDWTIACWVVASVVCAAICVGSGSTACLACFAVEFTACSAVDAILHGRCAAEFAKDVTACRDVYNRLLEGK